MLRRALAFIVPLLLPILAYMVWSWFVDRREARSLPPSRYPWGWLVGIGLFLSILTLVLLGSVFPRDPLRVYVPSHMSHGKLVPGHFDKNRRLPYRSGS